MIKIHFKHPKCTDVVVLYKDNEALIKKYVLKSIEHQFIDFPSLWLHPYTLWATIRLIKKDFFRNIKVARFTIKNLIKLFFEKNLQAYLKSTKAKVVLTVIDDSGVFHRLNRDYKGPVFIAIQNGNRLNHYYEHTLKLPNRFSNEIVIDNYFCFGEHDVQKCRNCGAQVKSYITSGSFFGGIFLEQLKNDAKVKYDLCYISSFVNSKKPRSGDKTLEELWLSDTEGAKILEKNLKKLVLEKNLSLAIALKYENSEEEYRYFRQIFGDAVTICKASRKDFSSYRTVFQSKISVSTCSTIGVEALGAGKRTLFVNSLACDQVEMSVAEDFYLEGPDYELLKNTVLENLDMSSEKFSQKNNCVSKKIMNYNANEYAHVKVRRMILDAVKS